MASLSQERTASVADAPKDDGPIVAAAVAAFLVDLAHAGRSAHTRRAYAADLAAFQTTYDGPVAGITADTLRAFFATVAHLRPATRARKQAAVASFLKWAYRQDFIAADPMVKVERVRADLPQPRGLKREQVAAILAAIPTTQTRDRLLFRLLAETGLRIGEALGLYVEDLDLTPDDEHLTIVGKGGKRRTVLLDDPALVAQLRTYLTQRRYKHGPLFRAAKNGRGGPLRYQSVQERWQRYRTAAGIACTLHQLRHSHATELVNGGVSLATIRKRLGHTNVQTTLRYAEQADPTADGELRTWRRQQDRREYGRPRTIDRRRDGNQR
jgi:site-specific recombinase XerD